MKEGETRTNRLELMKGGEYKTLEIRKVREYKTLVDYILKKFIEKTDEKQDSRKTQKKVFKFVTQ